MRAILSFPGACMRSISALLAGVFVLAASAAFADSRVFIIANQADGYGVDQCLAKGEKCGAHAARSYCQSRDFAQALSYRRVDPDEITGSVPKAVGETATMPAATNSSPSPASAKAACASRAVPATPAPRKRRDAAPRSGYGRPRWPRLRFPRSLVSLRGIARNGRICLKRCLPPAPDGFWPAPCCLAASR